MELFRVIPELFGEIPELFGETPELFGAIPELSGTVEGCHLAHASSMQITFFALLSTFIHAK